MSTAGDLTAALKTVVDTVANIGTTHAYERWNADWSTYLDQFAATISGQKQMRGAIVTLDQRDPIQGVPFAMGKTRRGYNALVVLLLGLKDSSSTELTFWTLAEGVMDAIDAKKNLSVSGVIDFSVGPSSLRLYQIRQFGSVLCHYGEIAVPVFVEKAVAYS